MDQIFPNTLLRGTRKEPLQVAAIRVTVLPAGANFCKACSLNGMPRREILSLADPNLSQFVRSPEIAGSVSGLFCVYFKPGLINLGAEVHEKSAVKLRDF